MYSNFTSLSTTYDYSPPQVQLTMPLLTNRRYGSALATKHPYLTVWARLPTSGTSHQIQTPGSNQNQGSCLPPSAWNILPLFSELTASLPARLSWTVPSSRKQTIFSTEYTQHITMVPSVYIHVSVPASPRAHGAVHSNTSNIIQHNASNLRRQ